jgi:uncharacterized RDD family membrane protein YckC
MLAPYTHETAKGASLQDAPVPPVPGTPTDLTANFPAGVTLTSKSRRLGSALLDGVLAIATLGIGYLIWMLFTFKTGQTPAKRLLGVRIISTNDYKAASWGITFLRDVFVKGIIGGVTLGIAYLWILWDKDNQALYDKVMSTVVVNDPMGATLRGAALPAAAF